MEKSPSIATVRRPMHRLLVFCSLALAALLYLTTRLHFEYSRISHRPHHAREILALCRSLNIEAGPPKNFHQRVVSDRFAPGTKPTLIKRARIWTGRKNGTEVIFGDILMDKGLIKNVGHLRSSLLNSYGSDLVVIDARGAWITPGIVDIHSHIGDAPSPELSGATDDNSLKGSIQPWLRSLDGINTHDDSYLLSISGGVTTALVLPGSANAIGGQAFVIKFRQTADRTPTSMLLEPPYQINGSYDDTSGYRRWRYMKHACGENPAGQYDSTRMDVYWAFRDAYNTAAQIKMRQDQYCSRAFSEDWKDLGEFPQDLQWEALVDVLRGRVKVNAHCYETVDLDALVRLSKEFKFPISAFHHASEAYLAPDLLKRAYGETPAVALFATNSRYKREAYRASEFAPRILAEQGIRISMKSDHPVLNSRYLLYEAQQAYFYGLPENLAIASVTSTSAEVMGLGHRIGYVRPGWDADLVIWDSHPLALGATPSQVFIDGVPQLQAPHVVHKPGSFQTTPKVPNFDKEAKEAVRYDGLPPLDPHYTPRVVMFTNVKNVFTRGSGSVASIFSADDPRDFGVVIAIDGSLVCSGSHASCLEFLHVQPNATVIDLKGGSVFPGLVSFGAPLGLQHIDQEDSTTDGKVYDPLVQPIPDILGGHNAIVRAVDGLMFSTRDALLAYRAGVTTGITAPAHENFYGGLGVLFSLGARHRLEQGAVVQDITGLHISVKHRSEPGVSTQIAALRRLLLGRPEGAIGHWMTKVKSAEMPLVIEADNADIIATLIMLKREVELAERRSIKMTITGGSEAHLLAKELSESNVGVILRPPRPFPGVWEQRRILPGPPLSNASAVMELMSHGVMVGLGCEDIWFARNLPFDIAWAAIESGGKMSQEEAIALGSTNLEILLGAETKEGASDLVAMRGGGLLELNAKVVAVMSPRRRTVDIFESP